MVQYTRVKDDHPPTIDHRPRRRKENETMKNAEIIASNTATKAERLAAIIRTATNDKSPAETAEKLLNNLGSLANVLEAPAETLTKYASKATAEKLASLLPIFRAYTAEKASEPRTIANRKTLEDFCRGLLEGKQREEFHVVAVNARCQLLATKRISEGSISECSAYPREIAKFALDVNAHSVFLTHNHPGGTCAPSAEDISSTLQIQRMLKQLGIMTLDHMIVAGVNTYSMAQHGDIEF